MQPSVNYSPEGRRGEKNYDGPTVKVRDWGTWNRWACGGCSTEERAVRALCYRLMDSQTTLQRDGQMDGVSACGTAEWIYLTLLVEK